MSKMTLSFFDKLSIRAPDLRVKILNDMKNPPDLLETWIAKSIIGKPSRAIDVEIAALAVLKNSRFPFAKIAYNKYWQILQKSFFVIDYGWKASESELFTFASFVSQEMYGYIPFLNLKLFYGDKQVDIYQLYDHGERALNSYLKDGIKPNIIKEFASHYPGRNYRSATQGLVGNIYPCIVGFPDCQIEDISDSFPLILGFVPGKKIVACQGEITLRSRNITEQPVWHPYVSIYNCKYVPRLTEVTEVPPLEKFVPIQAHDVIVFTRTDVEAWGGGIVKLHEQIEGNRFRCTLYSEIQNKNSYLSDVKVLYRDCLWYESRKRLWYHYDHPCTASDEIATFKADSL